MFAVGNGNDQLPNEKGITCKLMQKIIVINSRNAIFILHINVFDSGKVS